MTEEKCIHWKPLFCVNQLNAFKEKLIHLCISHALCEVVRSTLLWDVLWTGTICMKIYKYSLAKEERVDRKGWWEQQDQRDMGASWTAIFSTPYSNGFNVLSPLGGQNSLTRAGCCYVDIVHKIWQTAKTHKNIWIIFCDNTTNLPHNPQERKTHVQGKSVLTVILLSVTSQILSHQGWKSNHNVFIIFLL